MDTFVRGTCEMMCPASEIEMRTKERLLHFFEVEDPNAKVRKPNRMKVVKSFGRSAAGVKTPKPSDLRTPKALKSTVEYLLTSVIQDKRRPFPFIYDFIFDRLRSVRQEIVIQNFNSKITIELLEPIVMFLAYSSYRLCETPISDFDPKICSQHLQECLKKLLCCYDNCENSGECNSQNRAFIESIYIIYNLGCPEALARAISLDERLKINEFVQYSVKISLANYCGNNFKSLKLIDDLPHILYCLAAMKFPRIRHDMLVIFSHGYHSKTFSVPVSWLMKILFYDDVDLLVRDCRYYGVKVELDNKTDRKGYKVIFNKNEFSLDVDLLPPKYTGKAEEKLKDIFLPDVLLLKDF